MEPDFSGYVSRANRKCTDGRTIMPGAFKHQDGQNVPLVYQHNHKDINQVLGFVTLSEREDGTWGDAYLNGTSNSLVAKTMVQKKNIDKFSVWAKHLQQSGDLVHAGDIQEVSLVLAGANPGATIENVLMHSGLDDVDDMILIPDDTLELLHSESAEDESDEGEEPPLSDETVSDIIETLSDKQEAAVNYVIDRIVAESVTEALTNAELQHTNLQEENKMGRNIFDGQSADKNKNQLAHSDVTAILAAAKGPDGRGGDNAASSLRSLVRSDAGRELMHADTYGIDNVEILFPEAQALMNTPRFIDRRQEWVKTFLGQTHKSPFSRVKTTHADITADEARAKGYLKGNRKYEEVFPLFKRTTGPGWVYKKQKLDRQDIIDIKDFDVVAWMKVEMRGKLDEEIARAGMFGDGRAIDHPDKIQEPSGQSGDGIRSIINDDDLYTTTYTIPLPAVPGNSDYERVIDTVTINREDYRGSGNLVAFMSYRTAAKLLTIRDGFGHRVYKNLSDLAGDLDVSKIERVPSDIFPADVLMVLVDLRDYNFGTDRGGEVTLFDDFDIDFNQYKYLMEAYMSGALVEPFSAQVYKTVLSTTNTEVTPTKPAIVNNVITVPTQTGVRYVRTDTHAILTNGSTITLTETTLPIVEIEAQPTTGYFFVSNHDSIDSWTFEFEE